MALEVHTVIAHPIAVQRLHAALQFAVIPAGPHLIGQATKLAQI